MANSRMEVEIGVIQQTHSDELAVHRDVRAQVQAPVGVPPHLINNFYGGHGDGG